MIYLRLNKKPQIDVPSFTLPEDLHWIELFYKNKLVNSLKCDTILAIGKI